MCDEKETIERNPKSWAAWKREAERLQSELERLQQPIKLPNYRNSPDMHTKQYFMAIGFNEGLDAANNAIRAAGFKVEGDE